MLSTSVAAPQILSKILCPSWHEGHGHGEACPEKGSEADEEPGAQVLLGAAEGV